MVLIKIAGVLLALLGFHAWLGSLWKRVFAFRPGYRAVHFAQGEDGGRVALYHYPPEARKYGRAVILCHGLGANRYNFDLGAKVSLARFLQREGFDVWAVDMPGRGEREGSAKAQTPFRAPRLFDDYVRYDAPAAIAYVRSASGCDQVHWVGHSLGGLILYGLLQGKAGGAVASGVAVASPARFRHLGRVPLLRALFWGLRLLPRVHLSFWAPGWAPVLAWVRLPGGEAFLNPRNAEPVYVARALCHLVSDISRGEALQCMEWLRHRSFRTYDGSRVYEDHLAGIRTPLFLIAGTRDHLASAKGVSSVYERVGSERKQLLILGKAYGQAEEYGHGDLLIGRHCEQDVFRPIADWLISMEAGAEGSPGG